MENQPMVFVVDDDPAVRESLRFLMKSVGQRFQGFPSAQAFLDAWDPAQPGCLILDIRMPGMSGLELMRRLREKDGTLPVIIITGHADVAMAVQAMKGGAIDLIEKPFNDQVLLDCIQAAFKVNAALRARRDRRAEVMSRLASLTPREREVLDMVVEGKTSKEIALEMGISRKTLGIHRSRALEKMGATSLVEIAHMMDATKEPGKGP